MEQIIANLDDIKPMSKGLIKHLRSELTTIVLERNEFLLKKGQICNHIYFVEQGLLRCYYDQYNKDVTAWMMTENRIIISVSSWYTRTPSIESIIAHEKSTLTGLSYDQMMNTYKMFPEFEHHGRIITEHYYLMCNERLYGIRMLKASDRFLHLWKTQPEIFQRMPAKYIASYLGITGETFSRIRAKF